MKPYKYIDLFSGAGGLSLGFGDAGFDLQLANDYLKKINNLNSEPQRVNG